MKNFLLKQYLLLCEKMLNLPEPIKDPDVETYLAAAWMSPGFRKYSSHRLMRLKDSLANGVGLKEHDRDDYVRFTGQRVESLWFAKQCKEAYDRKQKEKLSTANAQK